MHMTRRIIAVILSVTILFSLSVTAFAAPIEKAVETAVVNSASSRYAEHDAMAIRKEIALMSIQSGTQFLSNEYIGFNIDGTDTSESGRFTIGNVEGNPNYTSDNNKILMYGHPSPWSSYTTIRIGSTNYIFQAQEHWYDTETLTAVSTMTAEDVLITQTLQIVENTGTGLADTVRIHYTAENLSPTAKSIGIRIMLDTMLGHNDGAPFKVPSIGNITYEKELVGNQIPQFWQAFDSLENASVFAVGTFYKANERKPDKVQFTAWGNVYDSSRAWSYTVDPDNPVTGDSAVSVYWNSVSVPANSSTSVSTYYGVGYANDENENGVSTQIPQNGFGIQIVDENGAPINGATVTAENLSTPQTRTTGEDGIADFSAVPVGTTDERTVTLKIEKENYQTITVDRVITKGSLTAATIYEDDGKAHIISAKSTINGTSFDLLHNYKYFKENADDTQRAEDESNVKWLKIHVEASSDNRINKYQLLQGGHVVAESTFSPLSIPVFTGTPQDPDKYGTDWRIDKLSAGKNVYLRVVDENGTASEQKLTGIKVSKPTLYGMSDTEGSIDLGKALKINVPSDVPIIGDTEIELGWSGLPYKFEVSEDGKVKFAINPEIDMLTGEVDWGNAEKDFEDKQLQAISNRLDAKSAFGGKPQGFGAGKVEVKANIMGYGEGYVDEHGNLTVDVGLVITISEEAGYSWTFFLGYVPVYVAVGEKVSLTGSGQLSIVSSNGHLSVTGAVGEINPKLTLNVDGGVGANGVLNIGASGRATISWLNRFSDNYNRVDLTGSMYLVAQAFLFKAEKKLAEGTWTIYDSYDTRAANQYSFPQTQSFYSASAYTPIDRSYLDFPVLFSADSETVKSGVYPDASPVLVKTADAAYLFWLDDIATRDDNNRTALVYAKSTDLRSWSAPVQIFAETATSTADFAFDVCEKNGIIYIAISKANQQIGIDGVTIDTMAASSEIYYAELNTANDGIVTRRLTSNTYADTMPQIAVHNGSIVVAYMQNQMEEGFFGAQSTHTVVYTTMGTTATTKTASVEGLVSGMELGVLNNRIVLAYLLDTDCNYDTETDAQLWTYDGNCAQCFVESGSSIASPVFTQLGSKNVLVWYQDGNLCYTEDSTEITPVFTNVPPTFNRNFNVIPGNEQTQIIWQASSDDEDVRESAVYAVSYQNGKWSSRYKLFDTESELTLFLSGYSDGENTYIAHLKTFGVQEDMQLSTLCVSTVVPDIDISVLGVNYDTAEVAPGEALPLTIAVENAGSQNVDNICVEIFSDGYSHSVTLENVALERGETKTFAIDSFVVPANLTGPQTFTVSATCEDEGDFRYNERSFTIGYVDLALETANMLVNGQDHTNIIVKNLSNIPTDAILRITADEKDGAVLFEKRITDLTKDNTNTALVNLNTLGGGIYVEKYFVSAISSQEELLTSDNSQVIYMALNTQQLFNLRVNAAEGGSVSGDVGGVYAPGDELTVTATAQPGYRFTGWTSDSDIVFSDPTALTTTFTMPDSDATVTANFEDVSIRPSLDPNTAQLVETQTLQLTVTPNTEEDLQSTFLWTSSDITVATVDSNGLVTAVSEGIATITLYSTDSRVIPATCTIDVKKGILVENIDQFQSEHDYSNYMNAYWLYQVPCASAIHLVFDEQTHFEQGYDNLYIFNPSGSFNQTYTSDALAGETVTVPGSSVIVNLRTDGSSVDWGFKVTDISIEGYTHTYIGTDTICSVCDTPKEDSGWHIKGDKWYFYENGEKVVSQWRADSVGWVYLGADGAMLTDSWQTDSVGWCYVGSDGYCVTNCWKQDSTGWCYLNDQGRTATNQWVQDSVGWCYVDENGYCVKNCWKQDSTGWCYLNDQGRMLINDWVMDSVGWCYVGADGYCVKNCWKQDSVGWVYLDANGRMLINDWVMDSVGWCYVGADGYAVTNCWKQDSVGWCYLNSEGSMAKNDWVWDNGWYWLDENGYMAADVTLTIDGTQYHFNANGTLA